MFWLIERIRTNCAANHCTPIYVPQFQTAQFALGCDANEFILDGTDAPGNNLGKFITAAQALGLPVSLLIIEMCRVISLRCLLQVIWTSGAPYTLDGAAGPAGYSFEVE